MNPQTVGHPMKTAPNHAIVTAAAGASARLASQDLESLPFPLGWLEDLAVVEEPQPPRPFTGPPRLDIPQKKDFLGDEPPHWSNWSLEVPLR